MTEETTPETSAKGRRKTPTATARTTTEPDPADAAPAPEPAQAEPKPPADKPVPEWLRYTGQTAAVFMDLGGEIEPGQVVHPRTAQLATVLLGRGDFEPAEAPASDAASDGTAQ